MTQLVAGAALQRIEVERVTLILVAENLGCQDGSKTIVVGCAKGGHRDTLLGVHRSRPR